MIKRRIQESQLQRSQMTAASEPVLEAGGAGERVQSPSPHPHPANCDLCPRNFRLKG